MADSSTIGCNFLLYETTGVMKMIGEIVVTQNCYSTDNNNLEVEIVSSWEKQTAFNDSIEVERCDAKFPCGKILMLQKHQIKKLEDGNKIAKWKDCIWRPDLATV